MTMTTAEKLEEIQYWKAFAKRNRCDGLLLILENTEINLRVIQSVEAASQRISDAYRRTTEAHKRRHQEFLERQSKRLLQSLSAGGDE